MIHDENGEVKTMTILEKHWVEITRLKFAEKLGHMIEDLSTFMGS